MKTETQPQCIQEGELKLRYAKQTKVFIGIEINDKPLFVMEDGFSYEEKEAIAKRIVKAVNSFNAIKEFVTLMTSYDERFLSQDQFNTREGAEQELKWIKRKADKLIELLK